MTALIARWNLLGALGPGDTRPVQDGPVQQMRRSAVTDPIRIQSLRGNLSILSGSGGNILVLSGADAVLMVDSGIVGTKVADAIATLSPAPVRYVINTHWHFDHTDANAWFADRGATIIGHENTRKRLSKDTRVQDWDFTFPRSPRSALPTTEITTQHSLWINETTIELNAYLPSHTDSDLSVFFTDADVLHLGDIWWNGYPFIDYSTGGSIDGIIHASDRSLAKTGTNTIIVGGHGPAGGKAELTKYRDMLVAIRDRVAVLKAQGRTLAETIAAKPTAPFDATWASFPGPDFFTRLVYKGV